MAEKIKNPASVLFGSVLQEIRKDSSTPTDKISSDLKITSSAYRMIESGNANLNTSNLLLLLKIGIFHRIRFEKVSKFLIGIQILEPNRKNANQMVEAIQLLCEVDNEFSTIFYNDKYPLPKLFSHDDILKDFYGDPVILTATRRFLEMAVNIDVGKLKKELKEINDKSLCIFQPLQKNALQQFEDSIKDLDNINDIELRISKLKSEIDSIYDVELGLLYHNAFNWRNKHYFKFLAGIIHDAENMANRDLLKNKFKDNLTQLWKSRFNELVYIIISDNRKTVIENIKKFNIILREVFDENIKSTDPEISFKEGHDKIKIGIVSPASGIVHEMALDKPDKELWLYEDNAFRYSFLTDFQLDERVKKERKKADPSPVYVILTNEETRNKFERFSSLKKEVHFFNLNKLT